MDWRHHLAAGLVGLLPLCAAPAGQEFGESLPESIGFNRHVRPILSDKCFACHGPDKHTREADLRLDQPPAPGEDAEATIAPGNPEQSELLKRILTADPDHQMPPHEEEKQLSERDKAILQSWIAQGAEYEPHWSYIAPARPEPPTLDASTSQPVDSFIQRRLEREGLAPQPEADRRTLARRLYWDLLGMPPEPEAVDTFVNDPEPGAYERLVDHLLQSPHYGEAMAMDWLDAVRYADSNGYHSDEFRSVSAYRDYVIAAFNANMPFDQFTREQLGGDLLPNPTREQLVASGYNRMNQLTAEGGAQAKEYLAKYAADRVRTTATVWLGATMGCAECHDHKFDPLSAKDFYSFAAFFADIEERGVYGSGQKWAPFMYLPTPEEEAKQEALTGAIADLEAALSTPTPAMEAARLDWEAELDQYRNGAATPWSVVMPSATRTEGETQLVALDDQRLIARGKEKTKDVYTLEIPVAAGPLRAVMLETFNHPELNGVSRGGGNFVLTRFRASYRAPGAETSTPLEIAAALADYEQDGFPIAAVLNDDKNSGWAVDGHIEKADHVAVFRLADVLEVAEGGQLELEMRFESRHAAHQIDCFRVNVTGDETAATTPWPVVPKAIQTILRTGEGLRVAAEREALNTYFLSSTPLLQAEREALAARWAELEALKAGMETTLIAKAREEPRVMRILPRGNWLDESGEIAPLDNPAACAGAPHTARAP